MRWTGHVICVWEMRNAHTILVGITGMKRSLGNPSHKWKGNIKMDPLGISG
jgi:hypothetical protein